MPCKQKRWKFEKRKQNGGSASVFLLRQRTHKYRKLSVNGWGAARGQTEVGSDLKHKYIFKDFAILFWHVVCSTFSILNKH